MNRLYTLALYLMIPVIVVRLAVKARRNPAYLHRLPERFGRVKGPAPSAAAMIWVHAVSVGEVQAAVPLVKALRAHGRDTQVVITTTTPTGSERVRAVFGDDVAHAYVPYDLPGAVERFIARMRPNALIVMETELWPNLFYHCARRDIPVIIANARLSERSLRRYGRVAGLARRTLSWVSAIAAQTDVDAQRFLSLGAPPSAVHVTGSIKFEIEVPPDVFERGRALREKLGANRPIFVAASTHEGEEEQVLDAFTSVRRAFPGLLLILVPRHPERFDRVAALCRRRGFTLARHSATADDARGADVYLGDTMGALLIFYAAAEVAFIGGSLVPTGGHNPLEAAALGRPVVMGPHTFNFADISRMLIDSGAGRRAAGAAELALGVQAYLEEEGLRREAGARGREVVERNRGALASLLRIAEPFLPAGSGSPPA